MSTAETAMAAMEVWAPGGVPEVRLGDDLATLLLDALDALDRPLADGDIVCVTSKVVSKSEGRVVAGDRRSALAAELADDARVVARRGPTVIVRTRHGLTLAAAGIDASNVEMGRLVLLPTDPDGSARRLRSRLRRVAGVVVGVVVTDTAGRAWREGQTDLAVGVAGLPPLLSLAGSTDPYGNPLHVTAPAVADEVAGAAQLVQDKLSRRPFAVVRGLAALVLPEDDDGPGAARLVRAEGADLFGYGAREAVVRALTGDPAEQAPFGAPVEADELADVVDRALVDATVTVGRDVVEVAGADPTAVRALAFAHGWRLASDGRPDGATDTVIRLRPAAP